MEAGSLSLSGPELFILARDRATRFGTCQPCTSAPISSDSFICVNSDHRMLRHGLETTRAHVSSAYRYHAKRS